MTLLHLPLICIDPDLNQSADQLVRQFGLVREDSATYPYCELTTVGLSIHLSNKLQYRVDFLSGPLARRRQQSGKRQLIARACGLKKNSSVLDLTAGFGRDGVVLATLGASVTLIEAHPVIAAMLHDGLQRLLQVETTLDIAWQQADAQNVLQTLSKKPDVIYLDPMFAQDDIKAMVKKETQVLRAVVGRDENKNILATSTQIARDRVVVKRYRNAPYYEQLKPDLCFKSKTCRFDVYLTQSRCGKSTQIG